MARVAALAATARVETHSRKRDARWPKPLRRAVRTYEAVGSARTIASGKGVNDVVGAGAALVDHRSTAGHDFMNTRDVQSKTTARGQITRGFQI